ncbi:MAG: hypothetical protein RJA66_1198 [Actinomycetota bacterium]|jgi:hypothetical protein
MKNKTVKLTAIAAGAVVLAGAAFAAPSFAHSKSASVKPAASATGAPATGAPGTAPTFDGKHKGGSKADRLESTIAATITGVPSTVTDLEVAEHSALFMAYEYTDVAPTTQPTTGGHPARFEATALANGTVTGTLGFLSPKTAGTYKVAVYNSKTSSTPVLVTIVVDSAGVATATSSAPLTATYDATVTRPAPPANGEKPGKDGKGGHGEGRGHGSKGGAGWTPTAAPTAPTV